MSLMTFLNIFAYINQIKLQPISPNPPNMQLQLEQRPKRIWLLNNGLSQIVSKLKPQNRSIFQLKSLEIIRQLESIKSNSNLNEDSLFYFNVYELANLVRAELRNLLREGFNFKQKDNSLAYAIIGMMQINILWHCCESKEVQKGGGNLKTMIEALIEEVRKDVDFCLQNYETNVDKFELVDAELRDLLRQVLKDKHKYIKTTKYQDYTKNNSFKALHQIFMNVLSNFRKKIKYFLIQKQVKPNLFYFCDRIYLKLCYLQVATNNPLNKKTIQELAYTQDQKSPTYIYLLDSPSGMVKLLNYFQQAPTSAFINDKRLLKIRFGEINHKVA